MSTDIPGTLLLDPGVIDDPYPFYRRLQAEEPVWRVPDTDVVAISTYPLIAEAASRVDDYSSHMRHLLYRGDAGLPERVSFGDAGADALATADPPRHKLHRDVVFSELVSKRMDALEPEVTTIAEDRIAKVTESTFDFMATIGNVVPIAVMSRLIGFRNASRQELFDAAVDSTSMLGSTLSRTELDQHILRTLEIETWIGEQLSDEVENPGGDILCAVAHGVNDGVLTHQEGCVVLHTLLSAGGESTTSLIGNAVRILAERQDLQDLLRQRPVLIPAFIEEVLRLESPFRFLLRTASHDSTLAGVDIPGESTILLLWGAANRDASTFQSPDDIVLDRKVPRRHVAFGRGIHHCVGAPLARLESRVVLSTLLAQTSKFSLDLNDRPEWVQSLMVRRHDRLTLHVSPGGAV
jgi:cytochrome P450 family 144